MKRVTRTAFSRNKRARGRGSRAGSTHSSLASCASEGPSGQQSFKEQNPSSRAASQAVDSATGEETAELIRLAQDGEGPALDTLFSRYRRGVVELARKRMGPRLQAKEDPEDLAQTTFREAARDFSRYEYRGDRSFFGWLSQILRNKIRDRAEFHSAAKRDSTREISLTPTPTSGESDRPQFEPVAPGLSAEEHAELREQIVLLHKHLEQLSPIHKRAIRLVYFDGLSLREAGRELDGRSEAAVRMLIRRAADRLEESLKRE